MPRRNTYADHSRDPRVAEEEEEDYYEVFLSFCGGDTRAGLTDRLYRSLVEAGVCVYRDNNELHTGELFGPELLGAIRRSGILIPILSENYGSREWCLRELTQMMECKRRNDGYVVLPVFYGVKPAEVRHQVGIFGERFRSGTRWFDERVVEDWKQALREVCSRLGEESGSGYVLFSKHTLFAFFVFMISFVFLLPTQ